jgi:mRNA deadenylase 3'-5' endonuclease subunit Ccr4
MTNYGKDLKYREKTSAKTNPSKLLRLESKESCASSEVASICPNQLASNKEFKFTICTYNLLAQNLLEENSYLYNQIDRRFLQWNYRKTKIYDQLKNLDSDVGKLYSI